MAYLQCIASLMLFAIHCDMLIQVLSPHGLQKTVAVVKLLSEMYLHLIANKEHCLLSHAVQIK